MDDSKSPLDVSDDDPEFREVLEPLTPFGVEDIEESDCVSEEEPPTLLIAVSEAELDVVDLDVPT